MHHYPHHISDYRAHTAHLTMIEDGAYRRLLDIYYMRERPLPADVTAVQRLAAARTKEERAAIEVVLREFFVLEEDGWHQRRADAEISAYQERADTARANGRKSGGRPAKKPLDNNPEKTHPVISGFPDNNPEPPENKPSGKLTVNREPGTVNREPVHEGRARALPDEWEPSESDMATARTARPDLTDAQIALETVRFRNHAKANARTAFDWGANWRNWMLKAAPALGGSPPEDWNQRRIREAREAVRSA